MTRSIDIRSNFVACVASTLILMPVAVTAPAGAATTSVQIAPFDVGGPIAPTTVILPLATNHQIVTGVNYFADVDVSIPDIHMTLTSNFLPGPGNSAGVLALGQFVDSWTITTPGVTSSTAPRILSAVAVVDPSLSPCPSGHCGVLAGGTPLPGHGYVQIGIGLSGSAKHPPGGFGAVNVGYGFQAGSGLRFNFVRPGVVSPVLGFITYQIPVLAGAPFPVSATLRGEVCCGGELDFSNTASIDWVAVPEGWTISAASGALDSIPIYTIAAVPEPSTWLLLLAGIALIATTAGRGRLRLLPMALPA